MLTGSGCYTSLVRERIAYFGRFTHFVSASRERNLIRHFFYTLQRRARREILGEHIDLLSCLICGCSCFLCLSTGRSRDSYRGKELHHAWFAVSCSSVPSCTPGGSGGLGACSQSILVGAQPHSGLGRAASRQQKAARCCFSNTLSQETISMTL